MDGGSTIVVCCQREKNSKVPVTSLLSNKKRKWLGQIEAGRFKSTCGGWRRK